MIAVIFEFTPAEGRRQEYLDMTVKLRVELEKAEGFISIERFESLTHPGKMVSLSFWRDEEAVRKWRNVELHREAQAKGRAGSSFLPVVVAEVMRDYSMSDRAQAPGDSVAVHG